jgi:hypothetical protein
MATNSVGRSAPPVPEAAKLLDVKVSAAWDRAYAGEPLPVTFELYRPTTDPRPVRLHNLTSSDPDLHLDVDLLQQGVEIRPGERYHFTVPMRVLHPKLLDLSSIALRVGQKDAEGRELSAAVHPLTQKLAVRPAIGNEIAVRLESLCNYDEGTKVLLTLKHQGATPFNDLTVTLGPAAAIRSGKPTVQRACFGPGDEEQLELVVAQRELELIMVATVNGQRPEAWRTLRIDPPVPPAEKRFRFLEPRRLARDRLRIYEIAGDGKLRAVPEQKGTYLLEGGRQYRVEIRPTQPGVVAVKLNDIPGLLHVRKTEENSQESEWILVVDVTGHQLLRKPERLFYEMETPGGKLSGEIPICLTQSSSRFWQVAAALGLAITVQGVAAVGPFLQDADRSVAEAFTHFDPSKHLKVLYLLSIPAAWLGLRVVDWFQYQFRT